MGFTCFVCLLLVNCHALPLISHVINSYELLADFQWEKKFPMEMGFFVTFCLEYHMLQLPPHMNKYYCLENDKIRMFYDYWAGVKCIK